MSSIARAEQEVKQGVHVSSMPCGEKCKHRPFFTRNKQPIILTEGYDYGDLTKAVYSCTFNPVGSGGYIACKTISNYQEEINANIVRQ